MLQGVRDQVLRIHVQTSIRHHDTDGVGSAPGAGAERAERVEAELAELKRRHAELEEQNK